MQIGVQVLNKICQTLVGGFQRYHALEYGICGGDRTLIVLLGTNGRCWESTQVGCKIQSRTSNAAMFQDLSGWLSVKCLVCTVFESSGCCRAALLVICMSDTLKSF